MKQIIENLNSCIKNMGYSMTEIGIKLSRGSNTDEMTMDQLLQFILVVVDEGLLYDGSNIDGLLDEGNLGELKQFIKSLTDEDIEKIFIASKSFNLG